MPEALRVLESLEISYRRYDHEPVKTCAESTALLPKDMPGVRTKHLFLRDRRREKYLLLVVDENKIVDLKELSLQLDLKSLGMASPEELIDYLGVETGALSMLSLLNDTEKRVRFIIDEAIWEEEAFDAHPNISGIVLLIWKEDWIKLFRHLGRMPEIIKVPEKIM